MSCKKQTDFVKKKQYQGAGKVCKFDIKEGDEAINKDDENPTRKKYNQSNLIYGSF